jgi:hypothetical protein
MKVTVNVEIEPFMTPNFVRLKGGSIAEEVTAVPLSAFDSETLERMCAEFTDEVFKKARKERLPTAG